MHFLVDSARPNGPSPHEQQCGPHSLGEIEAFKTSSTGAWVHRGGWVPNLRRAAAALDSPNLPRHASECLRPPARPASFLSHRSTPSHPRYFRAAPFQRETGKRQAADGRRQATSDKRQATQSISLGTSDIHIHSLHLRTGHTAGEPGNAPTAAALVAWPMRQYRMPCSPPTRVMPLDLLLTEPVQARIPQRRPPPMPTSTLTACLCPPT